MIARYEVQTPLIKPEVPPETRLEVLTEAYNSLFELSDDMEFENYCSDYYPTVSFDSAPTEEYWKAAAEYTEARVNEERQANGGVRTVEQSARLLMAMAPLHAIREQTLHYDSQKSYVPDEEWSDAKYGVSHFNHLIRDVAQGLPGLKTDELLSHLSDALLSSVKDPSLRKVGVDRLRKSINGAQHELSVAQMAKYCGFEYDEATAEEDLQGIDLIVHTPRGDVAIDVKSSRKQIANYGGFSDRYYVFDDYRAAIASPFSYGELGNSFEVPHDVLKKHSEEFRHILEHVSFLMTRASNLGDTALGQSGV